MESIKGVARGIRAAAFTGGGIALALFGLQPARVIAQTDTWNNTNGNFSTGFSPKLTSGSTTLNLAFGGNSYTATDDLSNAVSLNSLQFTNTGVVTLARSTANGSSNTLFFNGPSSAVFLGNSSGSVNIALDMNLGLHGINVDGPTSAVTDTFSGVISGTGFVDLVGSASTLALTNLNNTYSGGTVFAGGTISINGDGSLGALTTNSGQPSLDFAGGTLQFATREAVLSASRDVVLEAGSGGTISVAIDEDTIAGNISGAGNFSLVGGYGTLILTGVNTYTGTTTIATNNQLAIGDGGTTGSLGSGNVIDNGKLTFSEHSDIVVSNVISGTGGVENHFANLKLTNANTYSGGTVVYGGSLIVEADDNLGTVTPGSTPDLIMLNGSVLELATNNLELAANRNIGIASSPIFQVDSNYTAAIDGVISGIAFTYPLIVNSPGGGTLNLNGANTWVGGTIVNGATLGINSDASLGAAPTTAATNLTLNNATLQSNAPVVLLNANRNIVLTGNDTISSGAGNILAVEGAMSGTGNLTIAGGGQVELDGANSGTGSTTINSGSVLILGDSGAPNGGTAGAVASGNVIDNGGLSFGRTDTYTVANAISGAGSVVQSATGTTVLTSSANTYSGGTSVYYGTLALAATAADGTGSLLVDGAHSVVRLDVSGALGSGNFTLADGGTIVNNFGAGGNPGPHVLPGLLIGHGSGGGASFTGLGTLSVGDGTSFLDFGAGNSGATFAFSSAGSFTGTLDILNWDGAPGADGSGLDELIFGSAGTPYALTAAQLADIDFVNPDGMSGTFGARQDANGSLFSSANQIGGAASAPEPGSFALLGLAGLPALRFLRRRRTN